MLKKSVTAIALIGLTVPAFADHCPSDVKAIDAALAAGTELSAEGLEEVTALRDEGEELHQAGQHKESVEALHEAMELLGMEHK